MPEVALVPAPKSEHSPWAERYFFDSMKRG